MPNIFIRDLDWAQSKKRSIDDETLCDLLRMIEYQAERLNTLDELGIQDNGAPEEALFVYILDALGVPPEGDKKEFQGEHEAFMKNCSFSREWFEELFYQEFLLNNDEHNWTHSELLEEFKKEIKSGLRSHYK